MPKPVKERDATIMGSLTVLMLLLWLGFFVHRSPRFAGSLAGHSIGIAGGLLMLVPLLYSIVKRVAPLKRLVTPVLSMRTFLAWHIYAGILGPILVLIHTGHRFESPLGIVLTSMTIVVVLSGYVGRYLMRRIGAELRDKRALLSDATRFYDQTREQLQGAGIGEVQLSSQLGLWGRLKAAFFLSDVSADATAALLIPRATRLAEARADLEYAIRTHETIKAWFGRWLKWHIAISLALYVLLGLHVWATIHFGLRWLV